MPENHLFHGKQEAPRRVARLRGRAQSISSEALRELPEDRKAREEEESKRDQVLVKKTVQEILGLQRNWKEDGKLGPQKRWAGRKDREVREAVQRVCEEHQCFSPKELAALLKRHPNGLKCECEDSGWRFTPTDDREIYWAPAEKTLYKAMLEWKRA